MELRTATKSELRWTYKNLLREAFPPAELKSLPAMEETVADGAYDPLVLVENGTVIGTAFLWLGVPGWALLDYLCVAPSHRNGGTGAELLRRLREAYAGWVIFGEAETPKFAPDPAMAERRLGFYARNHAQVADYESEVFGVRYQTLYWAEGAVSGEELAIQHRFVYESRFTPEKYAKYVRIPCPADAEPWPLVPWDE